MKCPRWTQARIGGPLALAAVLAGCMAPWALASQVNITAASRRVFLHVGVGTYDANNPVVNRVSVTVPLAEVGSGVSQQMTGDSTQNLSLLDGFDSCAGNAPPQILLGASYRRSNAGDGPNSATLSVTSPATLVSAAGDTIPISQVSWTVSTPRRGNPNIVAAGAFNGATQELARINANRYIETCMSFTYANTLAVEAGTYDARVTYTVTSP